MDWTASLSGAIAYMEAHLLEPTCGDDVASALHISPFYLQRGFRIMTGYSIGEYIRCRRLYLAALEVLAGSEKLIELAYKYGYDTQESFTKAFSRFHGVSPLQLRKDATRAKTFLPLKIQIQVQGGNAMDMIIEKMPAFRVVGFEREFSFQDSYQSIPRYWDEFCKKYLSLLQGKGFPESAMEQAVCDCHIGAFGICIDDTGKPGTFRYLIAGPDQGRPAPEDLITYEFPELEWAKFRCVGPMPNSLQLVNTKIFQEWLPTNPDYEIALGVSVEYYTQGDTSALDYESAIWIPVKRKAQ